MTPTIDQTSVFLTVFLPFRKLLLACWVIIGSATDYYWQRVYIHLPSSKWQVLHCTCRPTLPESLTCRLDWDSDHPPTVSGILRPLYCP